MHQILLVLAVSAALCAVNVRSAAAPSLHDHNEKQSDRLNYRLPTNVLPSKYVVEITPYFTSANGKEKFTFDGKVEITLRTNETNVHEIVLHLNNIEVNGSPRLRDVITPLTEIKIVSINYDVRTHKYTLLLEKALTVNRDFVLSIQYLGHLTTNMLGFYRSSYEENGVTK